MVDKKINILGTEYAIFVRKRDADKALEDCDGYTDWTIHTICVVDPEKDYDSVSDVEVYQKKVLRHEITHAFFIESGLMGHTNQSEYGGGTNDEQMVDWIALQGPKLFNVWKEAGCLG